MLKKGMNNQWLHVLNSYPDSILYMRNGSARTKAEFKAYIHTIRKLSMSEEKQNWVLWEENSYDFICILFALLSCGHDVILPGSVKALDSIRRENNQTRFVGRTIPAHFNPCAIPENKAGALHSDLRFSESIQWGRVIFCSSGSSGNSKFIIKTVDQLYLEVSQFSENWRPADNALFVALVPHCHIYGLTFGYLLPLMTGSCIYQTIKSGLLGALESITTSKKIDELIAIVSPAFGKQSGQILEQCHDGALMSDKKIAQVSRVFCAGGRLDRDSAANLLHSFQCDITEIFGSTETGAVAYRLHSLENSQEDETYWTLLDNIHAKIMPKSGSGMEDSTSIGPVSFWGGHVGGSVSSPETPGDEVQFKNCRQFCLLGRNNEICKIEGKRVSIPQVIALLEKCAFVQRVLVLATEKNNREMLLVGAVLSETGLENYRINGKYHTDKYIKNHLGDFLDPVVIPRSIRYLDTIPETEMSKISREVVRALLINPLRDEYPIVNDTTITKNACQLTLDIPVDLKYFRGHFSSRPIVPGVILLHWVYYYVGKYTAIELDQSTVKQLKFSKPVGPGEKLILSLLISNTNVKFLYSGVDKNRYSSGEIPILEGDMIG